MPRREPATSNGHDTTDDRIRAQRSSLGDKVSWRTPSLLSELRYLPHTTRRTPGTARHRRHSPN
jgi:hypothetical protein